MLLGRTGSTVFDEVEVKLVSDPEEFISIKNSLGFFCIAKAQLCHKKSVVIMNPKQANMLVGDTFFTTGFDGIYPEGQIVGRLYKVTENVGPNF